MRYRYHAPPSTPPSDYDLDNRTITDEGSGSGDYGPFVTESVHGENEVPHHVLWISGSFALLSVILAAYIFRHKDRFMSKLQSLSVISQCGNACQPSPSAPTAPTAPAVPEGQAVVTLGPLRYKKPPLGKVEEGEEESDEEQQVMEGIDAMHFNNTSYFFLQQY